MRGREGGGGARAGRRERKRRGRVKEKRRGRLPHVMFFMLCL